MTRTPPLAVSRRLVGRDVRPRAVRYDPDIAFAPRPVWRAWTVMQRAPAGTRRHRKAAAKVRRWLHG